MGVKRRYSLSAKLNALTVSVILCTVAILVGLMVRFEFREAHRELVDHGTALARMIARNAEYGIYTEDGRTLMALLDTLEVQEEVVEAVILDDKKRVLVQRGFGDRGAGTRISAASIRHLLSSGAAGANFLVQGGRTVSIAVPVISQSVFAETEPFLSSGERNEPLGHVLLTLETTHQQQRIRGYVYSVLIFTSLILVAGVGLSLLLTNRIISPLRRLSAATKEVAAGRLDQKVVTSSGDEIDDLSEAFNEMVSHLRESRDQLEKRSSELLETNRRMEDEIEERQKLEAQLLHSQKMEAIGHLAGGVAHDFNNILMAITSFATLLQLDLEEGSPGRRNVDEILASAERASQLTKNLLAFSRKQMVRPVALDVNEVLQGTLQLVSRLIGEHINVKFEPSRGPLPVLADRGQLEQVVLNMATNARDAMPQGGVFTIQAERREFDEDFVRLHGFGKVGSYVLLSFGDTGTGMDREMQQKIFEPFYTTKDVDKGTGLGLSIVFGIIKQHGGYLDVYSEEGRGSRFIVYLPLAKRAMEGVAVAGEDVSDREALRGKETILLAEDEEKVRTSLKAILSRYGYTVLEAENGIQAVERFREHGENIDLMVSDVMMPRKNGWEAYDEIRAEWGEVKVIFLSGYSGRVLEAYPGAADDLPVVSKPVAPFELLKRMRKVLDDGGGKARLTETAGKAGEGK